MTKFFGQILKCNVGGGGGMEWCGVDELGWTTDNNEGAFIDGRQVLGCSGPECNFSFRPPEWWSNVTSGFFSFGQFLLADSQVASHVFRVPQLEKIFQRKTPTQLHKK